MQVYTIKENFNQVFDENVDRVNLPWALEE